VALIGPHQHPDMKLKCKSNNATLEALQELSSPQQVFIRLFFRLYLNNHSLKQTETNIWPVWLHHSYSKILIFYLKGTKTILGILNMSVSVPKSDCCMSSEADLILLLYC
jgi:hypothetical protein